MNLRTIHQPPGRTALAFTLLEVIPAVAAVEVAVGAAYAGISSGVSSASTSMNTERRRFKVAARTVGGFTFIEAILSLAIFGIAFGGVLTGLNWNVSSVKFARETVRATQIMEEKVDTIRLYSWDQITTPGFITNQFYAPFSPASLLSGSNALGVTYTGFITIGNSPLTESYKTNIRQISIDLYWPSSAAVRHAQMTTFVSKYGLQGYIY